MPKILHTGDLHLDSPFSSLSLAESEAARERQLGTFCRMMKYAKDEAIDLVLISGDMFDGKYITKRTADIVCKELQDLPCPVVIAPGNHDPFSDISLYRDNKLPSNVYVFSSEEMQMFDFDEIGLRVCGYAFVSDSLEHSPLNNFVPLPTNNDLILCAHADTTSPSSKYAPLSVSDIERCGFVYAALGHIHNPPEINGSKSLIKYCGFPEGRSFDELGKGGAFCVTVKDGKATAEKLVFASHSFEETTLDVSGTESNEDIEKMITEHINALGFDETVSLCIKLVGTVSLACNPNEQKLSKIKSGLNTLKIKDRTIPMPDSEYLERDLTIRGEVYRTLIPYLKSDDAEKRRKGADALRIALCAIDGGNLTELISLEENNQGGTL